ncbi:hypothetical protein PIN31009_01408 [Pandoraea iniqua]|uniref:Endopeptidase n=1 Tax=Pandoraea iniqua TaxID=2508288 RepID=A0A5E4TT66_9BURK|nr:hypothetical protein [Pandoraea iniqua]VVD86698.1 hypothetical protein PIN31009_01408 [Pandoraea iniqua]VVD90987.1 hypothetical protein PIN31115_01594 [Pandoraea iniqua]
MKKLPLLLATLVTATVVMVGCSKKDDQTAAPAADTSASAPAAAPADTAPASDAGAAMTPAPASDAGAAAPAPASN